jgi:hypothetical protein
MMRSLAGAAVLASALSLASACAQDSGSWWPAAGFSLSLPPGWQIERDVPGQGLMLRPAAAGAPSVAVVTWRLSVGVSGPEGAAEEHERLLSAAMRYRRTRIEAIRAPGAGEGVVVEGVGVDAGGGERGSLFAAFVEGTRAYVVGTFAEPGALERARRDSLDPVLAGLSLTGGAPALAPSHPLSPRRTTEPASVPAPHTEGGSPGSGVTPATSAPGNGTYTDPAGFSVGPPLGWRCSTEGMCIRASSPEGAGLLLAPVRCPQEAPGRVGVADLVAQCLGALDGVRLVSCEPLPADGAPWLRVSAEADGQALDGLFALSVQEGSGLLVGLLAPSGQLRSASRPACDALASFHAELPDPPTPAVVDRGTTRRDLGGPLVLTPPDGWTLRGGQQTYDGKPVIAVEGRAADGSGGWFVWRQPVRPIFRELTEAMRRLGFRDGDPYYAYDGVDPRMVLSKGSASDLVAQRLLPEGLRGTGDAAPGHEEALAGVRLLGRAGEEVWLVETAGRWFIVSQASIGEERDGRFWEAACIGFGGTPGRQAEAARALQQVVRSATVSGSGDAPTRGGLEALIAVARTTVDSTAWTALVGGPALPALPVRESGATVRRRYAVPAPVIETLTTLASRGP